MQAGGEDVVFQTESELLSNHGHIVDQLIFDNASIKSFFDRILSGLRLLYNPVSARLLQKRIQQFSPDIIHVHNFVLVASPSILYVAAKFKVPVVLTLHNFRLICPSATLFFKGKIYEKSLRAFFPIDAIAKRVYRGSFIQTAAIALMAVIHNLIGTWENKVEAFIVLSQFAKRKFESSRLQIDHSKFLIKGNAVDDRGSGKPVREDFFLYVGRLSEEKGIRTLLNASTIHGFQLVILGDGPLRTLVENAARDNPLIKYMGFQNRETITSYIKSCQCLILPSVCYEGFPMTVLEAMSTGTMILASRLGAIEEIIHDRINGVLFEAGNEKDLASKIAAIQDHQLDSLTISEHARASYLAHYTPEKNYAMLMKIYYGILARRAQQLWTKNLVDLNEAAWCK